MSSRGLMRLRRSSTQQHDATAAIDDPQNPNLSKTTSNATPTRESRKSSIASLKLSLTTRSRKRKGSRVGNGAPTGKPQFGLLALPSELQVEIINYCTWADICALRECCKPFNAFITDSSSAIARHWVSFKQHPLCRSLYPPSADCDYWRHAVSMTRRWNVAQNLAAMLAHYVQYKTLLYSSAQKQLRFKPVALRIRRKMTPLLFIIGHYFSSCQRILLEELDRTAGSATFDEEFQEKTHSVFTAYSKQNLLSTYYMWLFLSWLFNQIMNRPSYAGSVERAVRGWTAEPLDSPSLTVMLIHGNMSGVKDLLKLKTYNERRKWANAYLKTLHPDQNVRWAEKWRSLDLVTEQQPTKDQVMFALIPRMHLDTVWMAGARPALTEIGLELSDLESRGSAAMTVRFLSDLAGYDLFHEDPPPAHILDEEEEENEEEQRAEEQEQSAEEPSFGKFQE